MIVCRSVIFIVVVVVIVVTVVVVTVVVIAGLAVVLISTTGLATTLVHAAGLPVLLIPATGPAAVLVSVTRLPIFLTYASGLITALDPAVVLISVVVLVILIVRILAISLIACLALSIIPIRLVLPDRRRQLLGLVAGSFGRTGSTCSSDALTVALIAGAEALGIGAFAPNARRVNLTPFDRRRITASVPSIVSVTETEWIA